MKSTFPSLKIELEPNLTPPKEKMKTTSLKNIIHNFHRSTFKRFGEFHSSSIKRDLVETYGHPILTGYEMAFREHRPVQISPDILWILILQGFTRHVDNNHEELRSLFVDFEGKKQLVLDVINESFYDISVEQLKEDFKSFNKKISKFTGKELINVLTADFSTTNENILAVSQISIMSSMQHYFEFIRLCGGSGFPFIQLDGSLKDWEKLLKKTKYLIKYRLQWWLGEIIPIIEKIINTVKGNIDKQFWLNMFKYHKEYQYQEGGSGIPEKGIPAFIDGWIVKFFPYKKTGLKANLDKIIIKEKFEIFPSELVKAPIIFPDIKNKIEYNCELICGFWGVYEDEKTKVVKPEIGWILEVMNKNSLNI